MRQCETDYEKRERQLEQWQQVFDEFLETLPGTKLLTRGVVNKFRKFLDEKKKKQ